MMKLKFDPALAYQLDAVNAVADLFDGQPFGQTSFEISNDTAPGLKLPTYVIGNDVLLNDAQLLANAHKIQESNDIQKVKNLQGREFSIEMETGTGKTYVYLRTIFELNKRYGLKKFIIVVPSVAIREGVLKSIQIMREHFRALYDNVPFESFIYDSKRLNKVRQFSGGNHVQIMVINIQAFLKDVSDNEIDLNELNEEALRKLNIIYRDNDRMGGKPIEFIRATNPVVIIDEPQSVDNTPKSQRAIRQLNPVATLRYSATHCNPYNLLYKLGPIEPYDLRLVKRIEVASIQPDDNFADAYVKLLKTDNRNGIKAQLEIYKNGRTGLKKHKIWVRQGDDLYQLSGEHFTYRNGFVIQNIDTTPGYEQVEFNQGHFLVLEQAIGGAQPIVIWITKPK
jgi:type III restriction enzyme